MGLPNTYTNKNETGCCGVPNIEDWQDKNLTFENRHFVRLYTKSFLYMPLNMGKIMKKLDIMAREANVTLPVEQAMTLSRDISPWKAEQLYAVSQPVKGADNVTLNGEMLSKVFEGPYKEAGSWHKTMQQYVKGSGKELQALYFFYTTCPKCAKHYGKNYVVALAQVSNGAKG